MKQPDTRWRGGAAAIAAVALLVQIGAPQAAAQSESRSRPGDRPAIQNLSEGEMTGYLKALRELVALGEGAETRLGANPSEAHQLAAGMQYSEEMKAAITSNGLTPESFGSVHHNAMMAYAALQMGERSAEMEAAQKQQAEAMEAMRAQMPPEQYEQIVKQMAGAQTLMQAYRDVPPSNVALVRKYRAEIESILDRSDR